MSATSESVKGLLGHMADGQRHTADGHVHIAENSCVQVSQVAAESGAGPPCLSGVLHK